MKNKVLPIALTLLVIVLAGCIYPEFQFLDANANPGCLVMNTIDFGASPAEEVLAALLNGDFQPSEVYLYDTPDGELLGTLTLDVIFYFSPVEYTDLAGEVWYKVWVYGEYIEAEDGADFPETGRYVWITPTVILPFLILFDEVGCENLQITEGIDGLGCTLTLAADAVVPGRVGPGLNRAIRRNLTHDNTGGTLFTDGYNITDEDEVWYRVTHESDKLWVSETDGIEAPSEDDCATPLVNANPITVSTVQTQSTLVYDCKHLGNNVFEWYTAVANYDNGGNVASYQITDGPFTGDWRPGCPMGETIVEAPPLVVDAEAPVVNQPPSYVPPYVPPVSDPPPEATEPPMCDC